MKVPSKAPEDMSQTPVRLSVYMILLIALVHLGSSLYLPALPSMCNELNLTAKEMSFTMTVFLAAFASASIFLGPLSDHRGRRILIQGGIVFYLAGSLFCAVAQGFELLIAGRILQGFGCSAIPVAIRAMAREAFDDLRMMSVLGWIGAVAGVVPVLAPMLGGLLTQTLGWRSNFYLLVAVIFAMGLYAVRYTPETLPRANRTPFLVADTLRTYRLMFVTPEFVVPLIPFLLCFAMQGAYLVGFPFIFISLLGMKPTAFGATTLALVGALATGRSVCLILYKRYGAYPVYLVGSGVAFFGGLLFMIIQLTGRITIASILASSALFFLGFGVLVPVSTMAGLSTFPQRTGTSSALLGFLTMGSSAAGSALLGVFLERTARDTDTMAIFAFTAGTLILLTAAFCRRVLEIEMTE